MLDLHPELDLQAWGFVAEQGRRRFWRTVYRKQTSPSPPVRWSKGMVIVESEWAHTRSEGLRTITDIDGATVTTCTTKPSGAPASHGAKKAPLGSLWRFLPVDLS